MNFNEGDVRRDTGGRFDHKTGSASAVNLGGGDHADIPERTRELFAEKELEYFVAGFADQEEADEFRRIYREERTSQGTRQRYEELAAAQERRAAALFGSARSKAASKEAAGRARDAASIVAAHEAAAERGDVRVATREDSRDLNDSEARELFSSLRRAFDEGDPDGAIRGPMRFGDDEHFLLTYPDGSEKWMNKSDADVLYKRLSPAYRKP